MNYIKSLITNKEEVKLNLVAGTILLGLFVMMLSGVLGCLTASLIFGGLIGMAYLS